MSNLTFFTHDFEGAEVRVTEDRRFSVFDVLVVACPSFRSANPRMLLKRVLKCNPQLELGISTYQFPGRGQRLTPVAKANVLEEILYAAKVHPNQRLMTADRFYPRTESQIVSVLVEAFADLQPLIQFRVHGCRIDLYLAAANIAIEIDEDGHRRYDSKAEQKREAIIRAALGCSFVRCDPYAADFNLGRIISQVRGLL